MPTKLDYSVPQKINLFADYQNTNAQSQVDLKPKDVVNPIPSKTGGEKLNEE